MKKRLIYSSLIISILAALMVATPPRLRYLALHSLSSLESSSIDYHLGDCYCKGRGVERNLKQAEQYYLKAAKRNHAKAMYKLGNLCSHRHGIQKGQEVEEEFWQDIPLDLPAAIKWYGYAAELCYPSAYVRLGYLNRNGVGMPLNYPQAFYWYRKAAKTGNVNGCSWSGFFYSHGLDRDSEWEMIPNCWSSIKKNYRKALKYYLKAARKGSKNSQYMAGFMYANGEEKLGYGPEMLPIRCLRLVGVPLDYRKAAFWYTKATEQGHKVAMRKMAYFYHRGNYTVPQDFARAFKWYIKAARQGDIVSMRWVGLCYEKGTGVEQDDLLTIEWYTKAANFGDVDAQRALAGFYYRKSFGFEEYLKLAFEWYMEAAVQKDAESMRWVGSCYEDGTGVKENRTEALEWYTAAARLGDEVAEYYLEEKKRFFWDRAVTLASSIIPTSLPNNLIGFS